MSKKFQNGLKMQEFAYEKLTKKSNILQKKFFLLDMHSVDCKNKTMPELKSTAIFTSKL